MKNPQRDIIIVGGGFPSLLMAKSLAIKKAGNIRIVEIGPEVGGQFRSFEYPEGLFDQGMHIYYDTCDPQIDNLVYDILSENEWNVLEGNKKDIAGIFFHSKLQADTPYPDLRTVPADEWKRFVGDLMWEIKQRSYEKAEATAFDFFKNRFGSSLTEKIYRPLMKKLFHSELEDLDLLATKLLALNRVALFDVDEMADILKSDQLRAVICYPDQMNLPALRTNNQRGLYPRYFGFSRVIQKLVDDLKSMGVAIETRSQVAGLNIENNKIASIIIEGAGNRMSYSDPLVIWSAGLPGLSKSLGIEVPKLETKGSSYFVNLGFSHQLETKGLYYFYCFDGGHGTYRLTDYSNYCPDAHKQLGFYPVCLEYWPSSPDEVINEQLVFNELKSFNVMKSNNELVWMKIEKNHGAGFPLPTTSNVLKINKMRMEVQNKNLENLILTGTLSGPDIFFVKDVLLDAFKKLKPHVD